MTGDQPGGGRGPEEIDRIVRDAVGEISPWRFDEILGEVLAGTDVPHRPSTRPVEPEDTADAASVLTLRPPSATPRRSAPRWLAIAAVLLAGVGIVGATIRALDGSGRDGEVVAGPDGQTSSTAPGTSQVDGGPPASEPAGPSACTADDGRPELTFTCRVAVAGLGEPLGSDAVLFGPGGAPLDPPLQPGRCLTLTNVPETVRIEQGACDGTGLRAAAAAPGPYQVRFTWIGCPTPSCVSPTPQEGLIQLVVS